MVIPTHSAARVLGTAGLFCTAGLRLHLREGTVRSWVTSEGAAIRLGDGALHSPKIPPWSQTFRQWLLFVSCLFSITAEVETVLISRSEMMLHMRRTAASLHYCRLGSGRPAMMAMPTWSRGESVLHGAMVGGSILRRICERLLISSGIGRHWQRRLWEACLDLVIEGSECKAASDRSGSSEQQTSAQLAS